MKHLPFSDAKPKKAEAVVLKPWYEHPSELRCRFCKHQMIRRIQEDKHMFVTRFECDDPCGKLLVFVDLFEIDSVAKDMILSQIGLTVGR